MNITFLSAKSESVSLVLKVNFSINMNELDFNVVY